MSSSSPSQHPSSAIGEKLRAWRAGVRDNVRETFADRRRRWRLIRTTSIWAVIAIAVAVFFALFSWDWFRGPLARYLSARTHRPVQIVGHLHVHPFSWQPWASIGGLEIGNPKWMNGGKGQTVNLGRTTVQVKLLPLLTGRVELPLVDIEHPRFELYADETGRNNWTFGPKNAGKPAKLPPIQRFVLNDGKIRLLDQQRKMRFSGTITTTENAGRPSAQAFRLMGKGSLNSAPFTARITGGPLIHVQRNRPYPFNMDLHAGATHITAHGTVTKPFDLGHLQVAATASGRDLADLYLLTGVVLPNTPAYSLSGDITRDGTTYQVRRFSGRVGDSDLHGALTLEQVKHRRFLKGDLASRRLDLTDLGALFGGPQAGKAPGQEKAAGKAQAATGHILPDAPLDVSRVRTMDADVRYRAASVKATARLPLRQVALHLTLNHGVLRLQPVDFVMPHGTVRATAKVDARTAVPVSALDLAVSNVRIDDMLPKAQGAAPLEGVLEARADLTGAGDSIHRFAAASNGHVAVAIPAGTMRKSFAELMGVNVVPGLIELLQKSHQQTNLRCMVADFDVRNGIMSVRRFVLDTGVVLTTGSGSINLGSESLNLRIQGHTKKPALVRVIAPFDIKGQLIKPSFKIETGPVIAQGAAAVGLGALLSPLAAVLPFLAPGGAHDANCAALLAQARTEGAPVKTVQLAQAAPARH